MNLTLTSLAAALCIAQILPALCIAQVVPAQATTRADFNILAEGAVADGTTLNTAAIQRAIDSCSKNGGGRVIVPSGNFVIGTIFLRNGVRLHLEQGATLLGSTEITDYVPVEGTIKKDMVRALIGAVDAKDIGIEGKGTVDGRGAPLRAKSGATRAVLVRFARCEQVSLADVHLINSAAWTVHLFQCRNLSAERVTIRSRGLPNNDGFDIDSCQDVRIQNCDIDTGDDAICLKTTSTTPCRNVTVTHCRLKSGCGAIKLGTESAGDFENIRIANCHVLDADLGAIKIFSVDGAHIRDLQISDITIDNAALAVFIRLGARLSAYRPGEQKKPVGTIDKVRIHNIKGKCSTIGVLISGIPNHLIANVSLENLDLQLPGGAKAVKDLALPEAEDKYPEIKMFGNEFPSHGVYGRHIDQLKATNVRMTTAKPDARPLSHFEDVKSLAWPEVQPPATPSSTDF